MLRVDKFRVVLCQKAEQICRCVYCKASQWKMQQSDALMRCGAALALHCHSEQKSQANTGWIAARAANWPTKGNRVKHENKISFLARA